MRHYPQPRAPGIYPEDMNEHLQSVWLNVRNEIVRDQDGVERCLSSIKANKQTIKFLQQRIVAQKQALETLGKIKENV